MDWRRFLASALAFTAVSFIGLFILLICQGALPWNPEGFPGLALDTAFNMTASFVTNTNWQPIAGETNLSYFSQAVGLAVQNFLSPAVGIAVAFALLRGLASSDGGKLGNFFVDVVRAVLDVLRPLRRWCSPGIWRSARFRRRERSGFPPQALCSPCCCWSSSCSSARSPFFRLLRWDLWPSSSWVRSR